MARTNEESFMKYMWSTDHKMIGFQYLFTGMAMALIAGSSRTPSHAAWFLAPGAGLRHGVAFDYLMLVTNHGTIMIFCGDARAHRRVRQPLNPAMIGCDDMVFPRLNRPRTNLPAQRAHPIASLVRPERGFWRRVTASYPVLCGEGLSPDALGAPRGSSPSRSSSSRSSSAVSTCHHGDELTRAGHAHVRRSRWSSG